MIITKGDFLKRGERGDNEPFQERPV